MKEVIKMRFDSKNKGLILKVTMLLVGIYLTNSLLHLMDKIPALETFITKPLIGSISLIALAGFIILYGIYLIHDKDVL